MSQISSVPRALESKTKLFGFELSDLLLIFLYLSISNFFVGGTRLKLPVVWIGTLVLSLVLFFVKRNKPDEFLKHWGEFQRNPKTLSAGAPDTDYQPYFEKESQDEEQN